MKAYFLLIFCIAFAWTATAQHKSLDKKVATTVKGIVLQQSITPIKLEPQPVVRLHKFKGDRIKKALTFEVKENMNRAA